MLLSIIIPCYNSETFIAGTLNSLVSQNLADCEVIVVNDGSNDGTSRIVKKFIDQYSEIRLIDKENEGVSVARNVGIKEAHGKFVCFLDSDDAFEEGTLDYFRNILSVNSDIDFFSFGYVSKKDGVVKKNYSFDGITSDILMPIEYLQYFFIKKIQLHIGSFICAKSFLEKNQLLFTPGLRQGEDIEFILNILKCIPSVRYYPRQCFIYQLREDSVTCNYSVYTREHLFFFELWRDIVLSQEFQIPELSKYVNFWLQNLLLSHIITYIRFGKKDKYITKHLQMNCDIFQKSCIRVKTKKYIFIKIARCIPIRCLLGLLK